MKIKHLLMTLLAGAAVFTACREKEEDLGPAQISINPTELSFEAAENSKTVSLTATRDWTVQSSPEWLALSETFGKASTKAQTITVTVNENKANNREGEIVFTIGLAKATLKVTQAGPEGELDLGDGTLERPFCVAGVIDYVNNLGADVNSPIQVFVKGKISQISEEFSTQFGNGTFYMTDDGQASDVRFYAYRIMYLGNQRYSSGKPQIKVGDEVIVYGNVVNYKGNTPETVQNSAYLYSLNGEKGEGGEESQATPSGTGTESDPFNVAAARAKAAETGETVTSETYYIKGKVSAVTEQYGAQYGNATFDLVDEGFTVSFKAFRILYFNNQRWTEGGLEVKEGDEVVVCGKIVNYMGNTPETAQGSGYLYSLNGEKGEGGGEESYATPSGTGTESDPFNVAAALAKAAETGETATSETYYIKGKVSAVTEQYGAQYGNATFDMVDEGFTASFKAFRILYFNNQKWTEGGLEVKVGDEAVVCGKIVNYMGNTPETAQGSGYLYSLNGEKGEGGGGEGGDTEIKKATIAEFLAAEVSSTQWYELTGKVSNIRSGNGEQYGNFDLTDETGTVYVYGLTATKVDKNDKSFPSLGIKEGDEITIISLRAVYNDEPQAGGTTPAYWKAGGSGGEGGGGEGGDTDAIIIDFSAQGYANGEEFTTLTVNGVTVTGNKGTNSNVPKYYNTGSAVRFYGSNYFTVSASKAIEKIEITFSSGEGTNEITTDTGAWNTPVWTGSSTSVTFTVGGTSGHRRVAKMAVTLAK